MDFYDVVYSRRAIRQYKPDMVPQEILLKIFNAANWAPSGMNMQQWEFIVVSGSKKNQIGESYARFSEKYTADWDDQARRENFLKFARNFGGSPLLIVALTKASKENSMRKMHLESVSAAFENLLLAACAEGLGTCWMTGPLQDEAGIRKILDIGDDKELVALTPIGYPDMTPAAPDRVDPELKAKIRWVE
ncbi:MAG: nitroreductase family protein [Syntrophomonadaceae bacterium]|nr:nitroreductase family protein [Syntrophomonadaceae bacterium]